MTNHMTIRARDQRFARPENQAAKFFNIKVKSPMTEVHSVYGSAESYTQAFYTECGNVLVIDVDNNSIEAALMPSNFDWHFVADNAERNYHNMACAAGLGSVSWAEMQHLEAERRAMGLS